MNKDERINYVYKYYSINELNIDALKNNYFYFTKPSEINDPFDIRINVFIEGTKLEKKNFIEKYSLNINTTDIDQYELYLNNPELLNNKLNESNLRKANDTISILSLSSDPKNILMWSHYADKHRGICLIIKTEYYNGLNGIKFRGF